MATTANKQAQNNNAEPANTNVSDFLKGAAAPKAKAKGKSGVPTVEGSEELTDKVAKLYQEFKTAESDFRAEEAKLLEVSRAEYEKRSRSGNHAKTMNYAGKESGGVQIVYQDRFTAMSGDSETTLRQELGENYSTYFEQKRELELSDTSDATIQELLSVLGPDKFRAMFNIKISIVCKDDMDKNQFRIPQTIRELAGLTQYKASIKVVK